MKKAISYVSDVILMRTREVITRESQKALISKHAAENGIEIVGWYEDEMYNENVLARPGVQKLLAACDGVDTVLVERVWTFSRNMAVLESLFTEFEKKGIRLEAATLMWDCVSQKCRRRFHQGAAEPEHVYTTVTREEVGPVRVRKPEELSFVVLQQAPSKA